jgi:Cys-rich repeat protein
MAMGLTGLAAVALAGCNQESNYCDNTGCYSCDGLGCHQVNPPTRQSCTCPTDCLHGSDCTSLGCTVDCDAASVTCPLGTQCEVVGAHHYCMGPLEPTANITTADCGCTTSAQCQHLGPAYACIVGTCRMASCPTMPCPSGQSCVNGMCDAQIVNPPVGCSATTPCPSGQFCLDGSCVQQINTCRFNTECNGGNASSGRTCVDQQCTTACSATSPCPAGSTCGSDGFCHESIPPQSGCVSNTDCAAGQTCVNGRCFTGCMHDSDCGAGNYCDAGICRLDTRPQSGCGMCAAGSVCSNGACRSPCTMDSDCPRFDVQTNFCIHSVCATTAEATSNCTTAADCHTAGQSCVNGSCH